MKLNESLIRKLTSDNITKKEYENILVKINDRLDEIVTVMGKKKTDWYDFDNEGGTCESPGKFDPERYNEIICITGTVRFPEPYEDLSFPTRWLWEDFEEEFNVKVREAREEKETLKQKAKAKREELKRKAEEMKQIIKSKLTKEELKWIKFKV